MLIQMQWSLKQESPYFSYGECQFNEQRKRYIPTIYEVDKVSQDHSELSFYAPAMTWMHGERRYTPMMVSLRTQSEAITAFKELYKTGRVDLSEYRAYKEEK